MLKTNTMLRFSTKQTSNDSTIDMYWHMVNNRYRDIHNRKSFAYDIVWVNGAISDANYGVLHCDRALTYKDSLLISRYKESFQFIIKQLELLKQSMTK